MCGADDVRNGYKGCFGDGDGPYRSWLQKRTLPGTLNTNGFTHEQCALAAAQAGYEVYAMQLDGYCFMGTFADVAQMKRQFDDSTCNTVPCLGGVGCIVLLNKVYSIGEPAPLSVMLDHTKAKVLHRSM
jgi:hypothetical protein